VLRDLQGQALVRLQRGNAVWEVLLLGNPQLRYRVDTVS
jgi:hypothetical protein